MSNTLERVFVCSPYAGDTEHNIAVAKTLCLMLVRRGYAPFAPHLHYPAILDDSVPAQRALGIKCGLAYLATCSTLFWYEPNGEPTDGMFVEMSAASLAGIPVVKLVLEG